jgi:hypothetical protein
MFQTSDTSCNRLTLGPTRSDRKNYTPPRNSVNEIFKPRNYRSSLTLIGAIPILPFPQSRYGHQSRYGQVAQLVERGPEKAGVGGSIPSLATILFTAHHIKAGVACPDAPITPSLRKLEAVRKSLRQMWALSVSLQAKCGAVLVIRLAQLRHLFLIVHKEFEDGSRSFRMWLGALHHITLCLLAG